MSDTNPPTLSSPSQADTAAVSAEEEDDVLQILMDEWNKRMEAAAEVTMAVATGAATEAEEEGASFVEICVDGSTITKAAAVVNRESKDWSSPSRLPWQSYPL